MSSDSRSICGQFRGFLGDFALDVDFELPMHGISALFGPSGAGKTTLLRCVAGLSHLPGRLKVGDEVWQDDRLGVFRRPYERPVGYVFQEASLFPHLSVRKNLMYGARRAASSRSRALISFDQAVDLLGIARLMDRSASALSGGERKRVAVGRALLSQPRLLLMDEPLSGLDHAAKEEILPYLEALHESLSIPMLFVSHDIREVARLADTLVLMSEGRNEQPGSVQQVLEHLQLGAGGDEFESGVVLRARVKDHDSEFRMTRLDLHGQQITIPAANLAHGQAVRLRVRARDVALATVKPDAISVRNILSGTVLRVADDSQTPYAEVLVDVGGGRLRARITRYAAADLGLEPGCRVYALIKSISFDRPARTGGSVSAGPDGDRGRTGSYRQ